MVTTPNREQVEQVVRAARRRQEEARRPRTKDEAFKYRVAGTIYAQDGTTVHPDILKRLALSEGKVAARIAAGGRLPRGMTPAIDAAEEEGRFARDMRKAMQTKARVESAMEPGDWKAKAILKTEKELKAAAWQCGHWRTTTGVHSNVVTVQPIRGHDTADASTTIRTSNDTRHDFDKRFDTSAPPSTVENSIWTFVVPIDWLICVHKRGMVLIPDGDTLVVCLWAGEERKDGTVPAIVTTERNRLIYSRKVLVKQTGWREEQTAAEMFVMRPVYSIVGVWE